ncbi:3-hydroxyacyl-ACP dehydratase FabZ family protein [uncultured Christiangramia sp.]|uniref:3-hydroxyacyl-ACP dehydratase FabZ family protein n=1 Tax=Christiangramia sp. 3-2217-3z TaxID=3417564 RepID=UPI00262A8C21|nr:3-hydroxyacyl-ACP dehydratase FabZ family protein [uncultured Christiangramia sp.]
MKSKDIFSKLPYSAPFLFVDEITSISENTIEGNYFFDKSHYFYRGHFKENPVTPGVILAECMAQIGVVSLGIYLLSKEEAASEIPRIAMTSSNVDFIKPVYPGEKVFVKSEKKYFRFNKLKCMVIMTDTQDNILCRGEISGMILKSTS